MKVAQIKPTRDWLELAAELDARGFKIDSAYSGDSTLNPPCDIRWDPINRVFYISQCSAFFME